MRRDLETCESCDAIISIEEDTQKYFRNTKYYNILHFSQFVHRGMKQVHSISNQGKEGTFGYVAFIDESGEEDEVIIIITNGGSQEPTVAMKIGQQYFRYAMFNAEVATIRLTHTCTSIWDTFTSKDDSTRRSEV